MREVERMVTGAELRDKISDAVDKACLVVGDSMGPGGRCAVISKIGLKRSSDVTKDGVTIMNNLIDPDSSVHAILQLIKQTSEYSRKTAGDGTTASIVLLAEAYKVFRELEVSNHGFNMNAALRGMKRFVNDIDNHVRDLAVSVKSDSDLLKNIISVSSNEDKELADAIFDAYSFVGDSGLVGRINRISDGKSVVRAVCTTGFQKKIAPFYINEANPKAMPVGFDNVYTLALNVTVDGHNAVDFLNWITSSVASVLRKDNENLKSLVMYVFIKDIDHSSHKGIVAAARQAGISLMMMKLDYGDRGQEQLRDIAAYSGVGVLDGFDNLDLSEVKKYIGHLDSVTTVRNSITIFKSGKEELSEKANEVIEEINTLLSNSVDEFGGSSAVSRHQEERVAAFFAKEAILKIGALSDAEWVERRDRADDAIQSARAALEEGVVVGGGWALAIAAKDLSTQKREPLFHKDEEIGYNAMFDIVLAPLKRIMRNVYIEINQDSMDECYERVTNGEILNAYTGSWCDNNDAGIYDPAKVIMTSLRSATTGATTLLNTSSIINTTSISTSQVDSNML